MINHDTRQQVTEKMYINTVVNCKKISTGSILAYDKNGNDYFVINWLVERYNNSYFNNLLKGKPMFILANEEIWSGQKWNNKVVQAIVFISENMESIIKFKKLLEEINETEQLISKLSIENMDLIKQFHQELINQRETNIKSLKDYNPNINLTLLEDINNFFEEQKLKVSEIEEREKRVIEIKKNEIDQARIKLLALHDEYDKMFD
jgi:mRNA-degrading endonuclease HigB of HigAB toxin-antitoxin module